MGHLQVQMKMGHLEAEAAGSGMQGYADPRASDSYEGSHHAAAGKGGVPSFPPSVGPRLGLVGLEKAWAPEWRKEFCKAGADRWGLGSDGQDPAFFAPVLLLGFFCVNLWSSHIKGQYLFHWDAAAQPPMLGPSGEKAGAESAIELAGASPGGRVGVEVGRGLHVLHSAVDPDHTHTPAFTPCAVLLLA